MSQYSTIDGTVLNLIFQNEENGYTVLRLVTTDGEVVTVVGCIPCAAPGENLICAGSWMVHPQHGEQFKAEEVERHLPTSETEILSYLSSGAVKGVGPATAQRMVDRFGADTLRVLEEEPERIAEIRGITAKKAGEIAEAFRYQTGMRRLLEFLSLNDLPLPLSMRLYRRYGAGAMEAVRANPYLLVDECYGVGFQQMDAIALGMGFEGDSGRRLEAAVLYELSYNGGVRGGGADRKGAGRPYRPPGGGQRHDRQGGGHIPLPAVGGGGHSGGAAAGPAVLPRGPRAAGGGPYRPD